ncbi:MAG: SCO family protein [Myxococcota bacterium]
MRHLIWSSLLCGLLACDSPTTAPLPYYDSPDFTPRWHEPAALPADFHTVTPFALKDQHNQPFTEADLDGKVVVVDFFFTFCPTICPKLTASMARIDAELPTDADVVLVSHTVAPEYDTPQKLRDFAKRSQITSPRWFLVTGERAEIYRLGRSVYFAEGSMGKTKGADEFLHTESMVLVDQNGHLRGIYNGLDAEAVGQLIADAQALLEER